MAEHRIPAIDRAVDILDHLALAGAPLTIRDLAARAKLARSTVYRTLNTLESHGLVRRDGDAGYVLGARLLKLARSVPQGLDLVDLARPVLEGLATMLGTSAKLSIVDGDEALVVAVAESPGVYSITTQVGRRFPLHAGAASKLLLAFLPATRRQAYLGGRLAALTAKTITVPDQLVQALETIREQGFSADRGEYADGVRAYAAPVRERFGDCIAAISAPFVNTDDADRDAEVRDAVIEAGARLSQSIGS